MADLFDYAENQKPAAPDIQAPGKRPRGRPKGPETTVVNIRVPLALLERLDSYVDYELRWTHERDINRATVTREALDAFLEGKGY